MLTFPDGVRERAFEALFEFSRREEFVALRFALLQLFFGPEPFARPRAQRDEVLSNEDCMSNFIYWFLYEAFVKGAPETLVSRFLAGEGHALANSERRYLEAMRGSHLRLYEVEDVRVDAGMRLRDCWDGTTYDVRERLATQQVARHSVIALRLRPDPDGAMVIDGSGFAGFSHADKNEILARLQSEREAVRQTDGDADGRFAYYHGAVIAQHVVGMLLRPPPALVTTTGEPVVFCKVVFRVDDRRRALAALERVKELEEDNDEGSYTWVRGKHRIVHAMIRFENRQLIAETHSREGAAAVHKLLEKQLGNSVRYARTEEQDVMESLATYRERPPEAEPEMSEMPVLSRELEERLIAEYEDRYYRSWVDTPLPALENATPRQAAHDPALRGVLAGLLKDFTASSELERRAGKYAYDFSWMWSELGVDPKAPARMPEPQLYQLKISLARSKPPIWRRVLVSGDERLDRVHAILNRAMGWTDSHLHAFEIGGRAYGVPDPDDWREIVDEREVRLADLPLRPGLLFRYAYDFGDGWEHRVVVEAIGSAENGIVPPVCVAGKRACPPEDIGGIYGFREFLGSPAQWPDYGPDGFDPDAFDAAEVNELLRQLPKKRRRR